MNKIDWHECHDNVTLLGRVLLNSGYDAKQLQQYYERPWSYSQEWQRLINKLEEHTVDVPQEAPY